MLAGIEQGYDENLPGDATHTTLLLASDLAYCYKPATVRIYGNVVRATHGETRTEVLGSGDASQTAQSFTLRQSPLTYLSAPTPSGIESALRVRVNDILWHETESLAGLSPKDRNYVTKTDDQDQTTVIFGNGREGARVPTGVENVTATYRTGIGQAGNVKADQINIVVTKPLGVKEVINPLAATGGANREDRDQVRSNAPLAVTALDRLISARDYEDFARTFAGISKASAVRLSDGHRQLTHLTIAGTDDIPISEDSDLYKNLREALLRFGDPFQAIKIARRFLKLLVISAKVRLDPDYIWDSVEPKIRGALLDHFSFRRRELGQTVVLSEVISTIQRVEGVLYVDVDTLDAIEEDISASELLELAGKLQLNTRIRAYLAQVDKTDLDPATRIRPAQLALLSASVPETLVLTELK
jgi:predicted phage baseplate assembly protein